MTSLTSVSLPKPLIDAEQYALLQTMLVACEQAWTHAILPHMSAIRLNALNASSAKKGTDFFTEADIHSERLIKETLITHHGENRFRIFGEEHGSYTGNLDADITIRIDPIDGTEAFRFGKPNWSIMIGAYVGRGASERQVVSVVYWPEYYNQALLYTSDAGAFMASVTTGEVVSLELMHAQDSLQETLVAVFKHTNHAERGRIAEITDALELAGARVRSLLQTEVKEAIETLGKRILIIDGDFIQVDFIAYAPLVSLGYRIYTWDGQEQNIDNPAIANKKLVCVPPGNAGKTVLGILARYAETTI